MTFAEYKQRKDKLSNAIVQWMLKTRPDSDKLNHVMARAQNTMQKWWDEIEGDVAVMIVNKLVK